MIEVALYGERCSGTNVMLELLASCSNCKVVFPVGFKHFPDPRKLSGLSESKRATPVVVMIRHPEEWLRSLYVNPWHAVDDIRQLPFSEFLRAEWKTHWAEDAGIGAGDPSYHQPIEGDLCWKSGKPYQTPVHLRNGKNEAFLEIENTFRLCVWVRLEDLVRDQEATYRLICRKLDLPEPRIFKPVTAYKGHESLKRKLARAMGLNRFLPSKSSSKPIISPDNRQFIWSHLNPVFESRFSYHPEFRKDRTKGKGGDI